MIEEGDTLSEIAKRYDMSVSLLCELNHLLNPDDIQAGSSLYVIGHQNFQDFDEYKVQVGDNLTNIAHLYGLSLNDLLEMNPEITNQNHISIGMMLRVPKQQTDYLKDYSSYVVKRGDSIYGLCNRFDMDVSEFLKVNQISLAYVLQPGERILVKSPLIYESYRVCPNDTLVSIAMKLQVTVEDLILLNGLIDDTLEEGDIVYIPDATDSAIENEEELNSLGYFDQGTTLSHGKVNDWDESLQSQGYVMGIDISMYQDGIDFDQVYKENPEIDFVFIRSFYFFTRSEPDAKFVENAKIAMENNVAVGMYFWPTCTSVEGARQQTQLVIDYLDELRQEGIYMSMPIALDIENTAHGKDLVTRLKNEDKETLEALKITIDMLKNAGYYCMFYSSDSLITELRNQYLDYPDSTLNSKEGIFGLDAWVARYYSSSPVYITDKNMVIKKPQYTNTSGVRQFTENGILRGITGGLDLNQAYFNYPNLLYQHDLNYVREMYDQKKLNLNR